MIRNMLVAAALSLSLGTAAIAQSSNSTGKGDSTEGMTGGWTGAIGEAFYSDQANGTLRSQEEIRQNWAALSPDQQAQVRSDCQRMASASGGMGGGSSSDTTAGNTGAATSGSGMRSPSNAGTPSRDTDLPNNGTGSTDTTTTGSITGDTSGAGGTDKMASMTQVCSWVEGM